MRLLEFIDYQVSSVLLEIRGTFKWPEFKKLSSLEQELEYAANNLQELGRGSSRAAFLLSNRYVLKVALPEAAEKGIAQNKSELAVYTNPISKNVVTAVYDSHPQGHWIVSEIARPLKDEKEFMELTGVSWELFETLIRNHQQAQEILEDELQEKQKAIKIWTRRGNEKKVTQLKNALARLKTASNSPVVNGALDLIHSANVMPGDVWEVDHWGKTADGRVVLIDYGFTKDLVGLYRQ